MRRALLLLLPIIATPALAEEETCAQLGLISKKIMEARQTEAPISDMMVFANSEQLDPRFQSFFRDLVVWAYTLPAYRTPEAQQRAVDEFRNTIELECYKAVSNQP